MKIFWDKRLTKILVVLVCVLLFCPVPILGWEVAVKEVNVNAQTLNEFARDAPAVTIRIDYEQLKDSEKSDKMTAWVNPEYDYGFYKLDDGIPEDFPKKEPQDGKLAFVMYAPKNNESWPKSTTDSRIISFTGTVEDPLFSFTFNDAAELANGKKADLVVSYYEVTFYLSTDTFTDADLQAMKNAVYSVASGVLFRTGNDLVNENKYNYGVTAKVHIDVRQNGEVIQEIPVEVGSPEPATFLYTITDIDVDRRGSSFTNLTDVGNHDYFSEQVEISSSSVYEKSDIYVPLFTQTQNGNTFEHIDDWEKTESGWIFYPRFHNNQGVSDTDPGTYSSGFAAVIDNNKGLDLNITSSGKRNAVIRTWLYGRPGDMRKYIQHRIQSESGRGGKIYTTEFGDPNKRVYGHQTAGEELGDNDRLFDEGVYIFPDGKNVAYTMIPETGCSIKSIELYDDIKAEIKEGNEPKYRFTATELGGIDVGGMYSGIISLFTNRTGTLERLPDGKSYRFTFNENNHDHYIKVTWEKKKEISVQKKWEDEIYTGNRPSKIMADLLQNGNPYLQGEVTAESGWLYTFKDLPVWDENDKDYVYTLKENQVTGYNKGSITGSATEGFVITNELETTKIDVKKVWEGDTEAERPASITVKLLDGDNEVGSLILDAQNNWEGNFSNLLVYKEGNKCQYHVKEIGVPDNYYSSIDPGSSGSLIRIVNQKLTSVVPDVSFHVIKRLNGLGAAGFTFLLKQVVDDEEEIIATGATGANGELSLDPRITLTKAGTYHYIIDEDPDKRTPWTVTYDPDPVKVTVEVKQEFRDKKAVLVPYITYTKNGVTLADGAVFNNTFKVENTASIRAFKQITNRKWREDDSFQFRLTPVEGAPLRTASAPNGTDSLTAVSELNDEGDRHIAAFENLVFNQDDLINASGTAFVQEKVFTYKIEEIIPENADSSRTLNGVTYTDQPQYISIRIRNDRVEGKLDVSYLLGDSEVKTPTGPVFVNTYSYRPASVTLKATKMLLDHSGKLKDSWTESHEEGAKEGTWEDWTQTLFSFELEPKNGAYGSREIKAVSSASPTAEFSTITLRAPGRYIYQIRELLPETEKDGEMTNPEEPVIDGLFYDLSPHRIEVDVTDNGLGQLVASVVYPKANRQNLSREDLDRVSNVENLIIFNREVPGAVLNIHAVKQVMGAPYVSSQFIFHLDETHQDGETATGRNHEGYNGPDGIISFDALTYEHDDLFDSGDTSDRVIYYVMEEKNEGVPGWIYDSQKVRFRVTVHHSNDTDETTHKHMINVSKVEYCLDGETEWTDYIEGDISTYPIFTNVYNSEGTASFHIEKRISGRDWLESDSFEFVLTGEDGAPIHYRDGSGVPKTGQSLTVSATAENRNPAFETLLFTAEDLKDAEGNYLREKTFTYRIHETAAGEITDGTFTENGMTYAADQTFEIRVRNNDFEPDLDITYGGGTNTLILKPFINQYHPEMPQSVEIGVYKQISGRKWESGDSFTFRIVPVLNDAGYAREEMPMPEKDTTEINFSSLEISDTVNTRGGAFGAISFTRPGYYEYDLEEVIPVVVPHGFTYSRNSRRVIVIIRDQEDGNLAEPEIFYPSTNSSTPTVFVNIWRADPGTKDLSVDIEKQISGRTWLESDSFEFVLTGEKGAPIRYRDDSGTLKEAQSLSVTATAENRNPTFATLWFTGDDLKDSEGNELREKTFTYRIHEAAAGETKDGTFAENRMTYAADQTFEICLMHDELEQNLDITFGSGTDTLPLDPFINRYHPKTEQSAEIGVTKQISGREWQSGDSFTFRIVPVQNDAGYARDEMPMPEKHTTEINFGSTEIAGVVNTRGGTFGAIQFTRSGSYEYDLEEEVPAIVPRGFTYSMDRVRVTVTVRKLEDGSLAVPEITYPGTDSSTPTVFVNTWKEDPDPDPEPEPNPNDFYFSFRKIWKGPVREDAVFTLYNANGTRHPHVPRKTKISDSEFLYEYWLSSAGDYYVIEEPLEGYIAAYENGLSHNEITDRVYSGGVITNWSTSLPPTGDSDLPLFWGFVTLCGLASIFLMFHDQKQQG